MIQDDAGDFYSSKVEEQSEIMAAEVKALRASLEDMYNALVKIHAVKSKLIAGNKYHHVLNNFKNELDEIFDTAESCLGRGKKRGQRFKY